MMNLKHVILDPQINRAILRLELSVRGVQVASYVKEYKEALEEMSKMIEKVCKRYLQYSQIDFLWLVLFRTN